MTEPPRKPSTPQPPAVPQAAHWWALGVVDAFNREPVRAAVPDGLSYQSGRIEGDAARLHGSTIDAVLIKARSPYRETHFRELPPLTTGKISGKGEPTP